MSDTLALSTPGCRISPRSTAPTHAAHVMPLMPTSQLEEDDDASPKGAESFDEPCERRRPASTSASASRLGAGLDRE